MPKIDIAHLPVRTGSGYPAPYGGWFDGRAQVQLGDAAGLTQFGVNLVRLAPGAMSSLRHWHEGQDEFLVVTEGRLVLRDDNGDTPLVPGDCAAFPRGDGNGHHIVNTSDAPGAFIVVGTRTPSETAHYSDVDMMVHSEGAVSRFTHRDGSPFETPVPATLDFPAIGERLTRALLTGDFDLYASLFALPLRIVPRNGEPYTLTTEKALREDFELYAQTIALHHLTDIFRVILSETRVAPDRMIVTVQTEMLSRANRVVDPFRTVFSLVCPDGADWRIDAIESSLGHINWTRGQAQITDKRKFDTD